MNLDHLHDRIWTKDYTCNEFLCEAWKEVTRRDLKKRLERFLNGKGSFKKLIEPISPCIVFSQMAKEAQLMLGFFIATRFCI